jgi:membrane associated rhomboid family serine protease
LKKLVIRFNSPVVLCFALLSLLALLLGDVTGGAATTRFFCVYRSSLADPLTYLRLFTHVLGHAGYSHYMGNMLLLLLVGPPLEEKYGSRTLLLTIAVTLVMMAFGMKAADAAFIGLVMGVMNVVPYAGPLIGGVVSVFVGIVTPIGGMTVGHTAVVIIGSLLILKGLDDFVLQPTLYSSRVKAHPLEIFLVILIAGSLAGILGMLLAIPSYTVLRVFAKEFFSQFSLVRKLTEKI